MRTKSDAVIVDELFARRFYPHHDPIGQRFGTGPKPTKQYRIVGVVGNSRYDTLRKAAHPVIFRPYNTGGNPGCNANFAMRSGIDTGLLERAVHKAAEDINPSVPIVEIKTQTALIDHLLISERLLSMLSKAFGGLALILWAIGLTGLLAYAVARLTNEIGVRMALGASKGDVTRLVLKDSAVLVVLGIGCGVPGALLMGRLLQHTLFELRATDPETAVVSLIVLSAVAGVATWIPARRAARIDPMAALREE